MVTVSVKLVPPSVPEVKQLSDTSVMLNWTVPENEGPKIAFFRVQYRRVTNKSKPSKENKDNRWKTPDIEIEPHVRQFEVSGLKPSKFVLRIVHCHSFVEDYDRAKT